MGYRKINSLGCISSSPDPNGTKTISPSGSIAGFHSAYIEDTILSITQLQTPFALGFCTTYITPQKSASWLFGGLGTSLDQYCWWTIRVKPWTRPSKWVATASFATASAMAAFDETWADMWKQKNLDGKCIRWKKTQGNPRTFMWNFLGDLYFFQININLTCFPNMFIKPVLKPPSEAFAACRGWSLKSFPDCWNVQLSYDCNEVSKRFVVITLVLYHELHVILI